MHLVAKTKDSDESPVRTNAYEERARLNLVAWIDASGYSMTQVADLAGIPQANLMRYVSGKSPLPLDALQPLAEVFGRKSIDDFKDPNAKPLTPGELAALPPLFAKSRPGYNPTEEDLADLRDAIAKIQARRDRKKTKR